MLVITCLPVVWGSNPVATPTGSAMDANWVLQQELLIGTVLTLAGGYGSRCQRRDTLSPGSRNPLRRRSAKLYICLRSQSSLAAKVMEMKLHRLRDVRSDYGLLKQHG